MPLQSQSDISAGDLLQRFHDLDPVRAKEFHEGFQRLWPLDRGNLFFGQYRNSEPCMINLSEALAVFSKTNDLQSSFEAKQAAGQGSASQPETVLETFAYALSDDPRGGVQQTLRSMCEQDEKKGLGTHKAFCDFVSKQVLPYLGVDFKRA